MQAPGLEALPPGLGAGSRPGSVLDARPLPRSRGLRVRGELPQTLRDRAAGDGAPPKALESGDDDVAEVHDAEIVAEESDDLEVEEVEKESGT